MRITGIRFSTTTSWREPRASHPTGHIPPCQRPGRADSTLSKSRPRRTHRQSICPWTDEGISPTTTRAHANTLDLGIQCDHKPDGRDGGSVALTGTRRAGEHSRKVSANRNHAQIRASHSTQAKMLKKDFLTSSVRRARGNIYARATTWIVLGQIVNRFLALLNNVVIARLLTPEILGLIAVVNSFNLGARLFSEIGINQNIIRSDRGEDPDFYNTAWTIQIIRGILLFAIICFAAYPLATSYELDELRNLFPVVGLGFILSGLVSTSFATLERRLFQKRIVIANITCQIVGMVVIAGYAFASPTVWALVFGILSQQLARLVISHKILSDISNKLNFEMKALYEIIKFGKWIFFIGIFSYLVREIDTIIFAKLMPISVLGVYSVSKILSQSITMLSQNFHSGVTFPFYARQLEKSTNGDHLKTESNIYLYTLSFSALFIAGITSIGDIFVDIIYGDRYADAGWMFSLLCVGVWFVILSGFISSRFIGEGRPHLVLVALVVQLATFIGSVFYLFDHYGLLGAITANIFARIVGYGVLVCVRGEFRRPQLWLELAFTGLFIALAVGMNYARLLVGLDMSIAEVMP